MQREGTSGGSGAVAQMKALVMGNSQMEEGQSEHDDHYGYGHLRVDLLLQALGNSGDDSSDFQTSSADASFERPLADELQVVRRSTARVPPASSTKPRE